MYHFTTGVKNRMPAQFKRIHMPKPLYEEIENFVSKPNSSYKTVGEFCREAGRMLTEHYNLREKHANK
jgi:hypothetical protein